ncbi:MAG: cobalamin biosynthesis protein CbiX [Pseudomonadota bacterium]
MTQALIIAHGQPSDPAPAEADLAALAVRVAAHLPGWTVGSATLADEASLTRAVAGGGVVFPLFMAGGWFTRIHLPSRLKGAGADMARWQVLEPLGCAPALHDLAKALVAEAVAAQGWDVADTSLILAAHGSGRSPVPSDIARHVLGGITAALPLMRAEVAFIDQAPQLIHTGGFGPRSLCLPYFAAGGGHVTEDIPQALVASGFGGTLLPPVGADPRIPALIAQAIVAGQPVCTQECRWRAA